MNPDDPLPLRDIHLPPEIGWWPPAPGWWLLLLVVLASLAALVWWWRQRKPLQQRRVAAPALRELARIEQIHKDDPHALLRALSVLLRRIAISLYGRRQVAGLTGVAWLQLLDRDNLQPVFSQRFQQVLTELPYRPKGDADVTELIRVIRDWLSLQESKRHV